MRVNVYSVALHSVQPTVYFIKIHFAMWQLDVRERIMCNWYLYTEYWMSIETVSSIQNRYASKNLLSPPHLEGNKLVVGSTGSWWRRGSCSRKSTSIVRLPLVGKLHTPVKRSKPLWGDQKTTCENNTSEQCKCKYICIGGTGFNRKPTMQWLRPAGWPNMEGWGARGLICWTPGNMGGGSGKEPNEFCRRPDDFIQQWTKDQQALILYSIRHLLMKHILDHTMKKDM